MIGRTLINLFSIFFLVILQLSFIGGLPGYFSNLNLIVVILLLILIVGELKAAFYWGLVIGFLLDVFSFSPFGVYLISLNLTLAAAYFMLISFLTDRSLYSFLTLTFLSTLGNVFILNMVNYIFKLVAGQESYTLLNVEFFKSIVFQLLFNLIAALIVFQITNYITHKLKPVFLVGNKKI